MAGFIEAYFAIDKDHSETITTEELQEYMIKNDMDPAFLKRWQTIFDPDNTGIIKLTKFCEVLGLEVDDIREKYDLQSDSKHKQEREQDHLKEQTETDKELNQPIQNGEEMITHDNDSKNTNLNHEQNSHDLLNGSDDHMEIYKDMETDLKKSILSIVLEGEKCCGDNDRELVKWIKLTLDERHHSLWHCVIVRGQYASYYSYEQGYSFCFKIGPRIYILFKTPNITSRLKNS